MNAAVFFLVSVAASAAFAFPNVKDAVVFNGSFTQGISAPVNFTQSLEITALDSATNEYTIQNTFTLPNGQVQAQAQNVPVAQMLTRATVKGYLAQCTASGGTLGPVTVPAGTFEACALATERGGSIFVAEVPFGFIKEVSFDEQMNKITLELASYVVGEPAAAPAAPAAQ